MIKSVARSTAIDGKKINTTRTNWTANNAIPDSIITNIIRRSLVPPLVELNFPSELIEVTVVFLTPKNTLRILNTIKPVTRAFTAMDKTRLVTVSGASHCTYSNGVALDATSQVTRVRR